MSATDAHEYDVAAVRTALDLLAAEGALDAFLADCKARSLKLVASKRLVALTLETLAKLPSAKTASPGGGCPACPPER